MYDKILKAIHARTPGQTDIIIEKSDGRIVLKCDHMESRLAYTMRNGNSIVLQVVSGGFVIFEEAIYEKWAAQCIAARSGKIEPPAKPRTWTKAGMGGSWIEK